VENHEQKKNYYYIGRKIRKFCWELAVLCDGVEGDVNGDSFGLAWLEMDLKVGGYWGKISTHWGKTTLSLGSK
jgi:hypothetical protein